MHVAVTQVSVLECFVVINGVEPSPLLALSHSLRYMVTELMGSDLNKILQTQDLTDDHTQFFVYQLFRGLKVRLGRRSEVFDP